MKKRLLIGAMLLAFTQMNAQVQQIGQPISWKAKVGVSKKSIQMIAIDNDAETQKELSRRANTTEKNLRFGKELEVSINFMQEASVRILPNGDVLRQLTIESTGAHSINLIFSRFKLASNARMYLFDGEQKEFIGAHTSLNNNANNVMGTELIHDDKIVIELVENAEEAGTSELTIGTVIHGYLDLEAELKALNSSGSCNYDVNCPIGAGWENQRNSVAMMVNGGGFCTGSLVNNTTGTIIPYFLSANHCGTTPASWVFRFRWESPAAQADCATSAPSVNGPTNMNVNGGVLRANYAPSDFTLTELNSAPLPAWGIYYNGWNRTNIPGTSAVGIHHPAGDIKKISFENQALISTTFGGGSPNTHWGVTGWDNGVTEGGSSGSPLFDQNHRTVGQLHGGASACGGAQLSDEYGKFFVSWTGGGANNNRLSNWLDPNNTGADFIDGVDPAGPGAALDAGVGSTAGVSGTICSGTVTPQVTITNGGTTVLTSATINYGYDGNINQTYNWTGSLAQYASQVITLPSATLAGGTHTFNANVTNPNGSTDENAANNIVTSNFTTVLNGQTATLTLTPDCYGDELTWTLKDTNNVTTYYTGGPYAQDNGGTVYTTAFCLSTGCYRFTLNDSYGDGMTSSGCPNGSYTITNGNGATLASLASADANFGNTTNEVFCLSSNDLSDLNALKESWNLYPNPAHSVLNIVFNQEEGVKEISIATAAGQIIRSQVILSGLASFNVDDLAKGVYFVSVATTQGKTTKTFIVE